jgi:hypothetical protein
MDASPTWYNGKELRSRCEADAIAFLDELLSKHFGFDVWEKQLFKYEGNGYRNRHQFYKPDWIFVSPGTDPEQRSFFEVKPNTEELDPNGLLDRMHCVRNTDPHAALFLLIGTWDTFERRYQFDWPPAFRCLPEQGCFICKPPPPPHVITIEDLL